MLALFNLVPAFPLDGGRVLRSIIWWRTGNLRRATRIASMFGTGFGGLLVLLGLAQLFSGNTLGGTWQILIGLFLAAAASQARNQTATALSLKGASVADLMDRSPLSVPPGISVGELVRDYLYRQNRKFVIVAEGGQAMGYVGPEQIKKVPQSQWNETYVRAIAAELHARYCRLARRARPSKRCASCSRTASGIWPCSKAQCSRARCRRRTSSIS